MRNSLLLFLTLVTLVLGLSSPLTAAKSPKPGHDLPVDFMPQLPLPSFWQRSVAGIDVGLNRALNRNYFLLDFVTKMWYQHQPFKKLKITTSYNTGLALQPIRNATPSYALRYINSISAGYMFEILPWLAVAPNLELGVDLVYVDAKILGLKATELWPMATLNVPTYFRLNYRHALSVTLLTNFYFAPNLPSFNLGFAMGYAFRFGEEPPPPPKPRDNSMFIEVKALKQLFPSLYPSHGNVPLLIKLTNKGPDPLNYSEITVDLKLFLDNPLTLKVQSVLKPGESIEIPVNLLTNVAYMMNRQNKDTTFFVKVDYQRRFFDFEKAVTQPVRVFSRNTITWEDDRIMSVFVNPGDEVVVEYTRQVLKELNEAKYPFVITNLLRAIKLYTSLEAQSFGYLPDPFTPFQNSLNGGSALDSVTYPRHMLQRRSGDCDDLTALFCTLLEAVGIETAFVTIPGHIFMMFNTDVDYTLISSVTSLPDWVVIHDEKVWIPVEVTTIGKGFLTAWEVGGQQMKAAKKDETRIYRVRDYWPNWVPVSLPDKAEEPNLPVMTLVNRLLKDTMTKYLQSEIALRIEPLKQEVDRDPNNHRVYNQIGVTYRKFGLYEQSNLYLEQSLTLKPDYVPALYNIARNMIDLGRKAEAKQFAEKASKLMPTDLRVQNLILELKT